MSLLFLDNGTPQFRLGRNMSQSRPPFDKKKFAKNFKDQDAVNSLKVPPHSFEAEQSVLGGVMLDNQAWDRVAEAVVDKDFYSRPHRLIFQAMESLANAGDPIDLITVSE